MRRTAPDRDSPLTWDITLPDRPERVPGVTMAGFSDRGLPAIEHRVIPHPSVTLVVEFGSAPPVVDTAGRQYRGSVAAGLGAGSGGAIRAWGEGLEAIQLRLSPPAAYAILGADLSAGVVSLDDLWGRRTFQLRERLAETSSWQERFALTDAFLARRQARGPAPDPEVAWAWSRMVATHGRLRVDDLAAEIGWSRKRLWTRFRAQVGLPPKSAAKLVRFDHAVHRLVAGESPARVAAETGYTDQSHLHRDVRAFTGATPATVTAEPWLAVDDTAWPRTRRGRA